ncbi:myb-like protein X isoform X2 [Syngnathus scovelli]|uniref:myb-like protein X isoform X2 n=1 Tax=Syngnathus scovelli TaxID=161590 RepID=UPI0021106D50|nr:uncharacterized protein LOC125984686 isoform X2 [Syngnathus scovelli]
MPLTEGGTAARTQMEPRVMKPEAKKKTKPTKLPPWPPEPRNDAEKLDKPIPVVPPRPKHSELSQTQYHLKRLAGDCEGQRNVTQRETKENKTETPVPPPRQAKQKRNQTTRHSQGNSDDKQISVKSVQSDAASDIKKTTKLRKSLKDKKASFISHLTDDQDRGDDTPDKHAASAKPGVLKGMMKHLKSTPKVGGGGGGGSGEALVDPNKEEASQEKERTASDKVKQDKSAESKQDFGGRFAGMFRKPPLVTVGKMDGDSEESEEDEKQSYAGIFNEVFRKKPPEEAQMDEEEQQPGLRDDLSDSSDDLSPKVSEEKGGFFSAIRRKTPKEVAPKQDSKEPRDDLSGSTDSLTNNKEKAGLFGGFFKKATKAAQPDQGESVDKKLSVSNEDLSESESGQDKDRGLFGVFQKKTPKGERDASPDGEEDNEKEDKGQVTTTAVGGDNAAEKSVAKDKSLFSNMFKKPQKPAEGDKEAEVKSEVTPSGSTENLTENIRKGKKGGGLAGIFKRSYSNDNMLDEDKEKSSSNDNLAESTTVKEKSIFSGMFKKAPKAADEVTLQESNGDDKKKPLSDSNENLTEEAVPKEKSIFSGMFKKAPKAADEESNGDDSNEKLTEETGPKEKTGGLAGMFRKSPKAAPRSIAIKDPLSDDNLDESAKMDDLSGDELSGTTVNLDAATAKEKKGGFAGIFKRTPKTADKQDNEDNKEDAAPPSGGGLRRRRTIKKKRRVVSFRVKTTLPRMTKLNTSSQEKIPIIEERMEMEEMIPAQQSTMEVQPVEMAAYPTEGNPLDSEEENDGLMDWWKNVEGWAEWNNFQEDEEEMAMEEAADRVYMAARLFVRLFNQRGASLQHCILELLALADAADYFHKKTISAAVGGGVASVAGSLTTITGLILAPFTFGASIIVTAVGIGVATAGSITSATANITDAVHSNMDRKKVEKMIQDYQEQIKDIRECMEFVQEGIDTLQDWDFEKYTQSTAKKALNHNIKHVVKEGGRAGKALMINTDKLISTVQVLGAGAGAAKAAQAISVTTGVMSALFLALDVFFLAKDSHELRKGAKTKFASKIRDVCKELQDGLLELNKVKTQLQKTMDGIEVEEYEEIQEVEEEVDDDLESDPKKLAELDQELDLMEEKLDKKIEEGKITAKEGDSKKTKEEKTKKDKVDKETENRMAAWEEKQEKEAASLKKVEEKPKMKDSKKTERERSHRVEGKDAPGRTDTKGGEDEGKESLGKMEGSKRKPQHHQSHSGNPEGRVDVVARRASQERGSSGQSKMTDGIQAKDCRTETIASRDGWDTHSGSNERRGSHRSQESSRRDHMDEKTSASHRRATEDKKQMSPIESARNKFQTGHEEHGGSSSESHRRGSDKTGTDQERRGSDHKRRGSDREQKHSHRGSRHPSVLPDDGYLDI